MPTTRPDTYSAASGGGIYAGAAAPANIPAAGVSSAFKVIGSSLNSDAFRNTSINAALALLPKRTDFIANSAFEGVSTFGLIGQIESDYKEATGPGWSGLPTTGWAFVELALVNALKFGGSFSSQESNVVTLLERVMELTEFAVVGATAPIGGPSNTSGERDDFATEVAAANAYTQAYCEANSSKLAFVDHCVNVRDPLTGWWIDGMCDPDGVHIAAPGTQQMAIDLAAGIEPLMANQTYPTELTPDSGLTEYLVNAAQSGTGGTVNAGWSGTLPDNTAISTYGGTGAAGTVNASAGEIEITPTTRSISTAIQLSHSCSGTVTSTEPATVDMQGKFELVGLEGFGYINAWLQAGGRRLTKYLYVVLDPSVATTATYKLQKNFYRIDSLASGTPTLYVEFGGCADNYTGSMGSVVISQLSARA